MDPLGPTRTPGPAQGKGRRAMQAPRGVVPGPAAVTGGSRGAGGRGFFSRRGTVQQTAVATATTVLVPMSLPCPPPFLRRPSWQCKSRSPCTRGRAATPEATPHRVQGAPPQPSNSLSRPTNPPLPSPHAPVYQGQDPMALLPQVYRVAYPWHRRGREVPWGAGPLRLRRQRQRRRAQEGADAGHARCRGSSTPLPAPPLSAPPGAQAPAPARCTCTMVYRMVCRRRAVHLRQTSAGAYAQGAIPVRALLPGKGQGQDLRVVGEAYWIVKTGPSLRGS